MNNEEKSYFERLAARVRTAGEADTLNRYLQLYLRESNHDQRYFHFDVVPTERDGRVHLSGKVQYPEQVNGLINLLGALDFQVENHVELITEGTRQKDSYGIVKVPVAGCFAQPNPETEQVTQARYGERVQIVDGPQEGHYLIRCQDAYLGWAACDCFEICPKDRWLNWENCTKIRFSAPHECHGMSLFAGTELPLRDGEQVEHPDGSLQPLADIANSGARFDQVCLSTSTAVRERIVEMARTWLETKYVWGGRTNIGTDCSGFVHSMYAFCGIFLPRDARHQFLVGKVCGGRDFMQAEPGDLLFFLGRTGIVTHVAISLGDYRFIHAGGGKVHEASLSQNDSDYQDLRAHSFFCAKRVITE